MMPNNSQVWAKSFHVNQVSILPLFPVQGRLAAGRHTYRATVHEESPFSCQSLCRQFLKRRLRHDPVIDMHCTLERKWWTVSKLPGPDPGTPLPVTLFMGDWTKTMGQFFRLQDIMDNMDPPWLNRELKTAIFYFGLFLVYGPYPAVLWGQCRGTKLG